MADDLPRGTRAGTIRLGDIELDVCIVERGSRVERVITQRAALSHLGLPRPKSAQGSADFLVDYVSRIDDSAEKTGGLSMATFSPLAFVHPTNGKPAIGYRGQDFISICRFMLRARRAGALSVPQMRVAERAEVVVEAFAEIGIIALIDEATGYQRERGGDALQQILDRLLTPAAAPWEKRFPDDYYREICRLRGWPWNPANPAHVPRYIAQITRDIVYNRLAPGVVDALEEMNPATGNKSANRRRKHHQHLTLEDGLRLLDEHLRAIVTIARGSYGWGDFMRCVDRSFPVPGTQFALPTEAA